MRDFAAIDFETANNERTSVCSVGVVIVRDGEIVDTFYSLIQPEPNYYNYWCTQVHGLTRRDTENAPKVFLSWPITKPLMRVVLKQSSVVTRWIILIMNSCAHVWLLVKLFHKQRTISFIQFQNSAVMNSKTIIMPSPMQRLVPGLQGKSSSFQLFHVTLLFS